MEIQESIESEERERERENERDGKTTTDISGNFTGMANPM